MHQSYVVASRNIYFLNFVFSQAKVICCLRFHILLTLCIQNFSKTKFSSHFISRVFSLNSVGCMYEIITMENEKC